MVSHNGPDASGRRALTRVPRGPRTILGRGRLRATDLTPGCRTLAGSDSVSRCRNPWPPHDPATDSFVGRQCRPLSRTFVHESFPPRPGVTRPDTGAQRHTYPCTTPERQFK